MTKEKSEKKEKTQKTQITHGPKSRGKNYRKALLKIDRTKLYNLTEAVSLAKETSTTKFDSSVEIHIKTGIDPKQADQMLRGTIALPAGTGKTVKVVAFVDDGKTKDCKSAGAIEAGTAELIEKIEKGWLDFDVAVATPDQMKSLGKIARILGQAGKMPNPKSGTVTPDPVKTIQEILKGQIEYRNDTEGNLHNAIGKVSFSQSDLEKNLKTYLKTIFEVKPASIKGNYINSITIKTSMGPGIKMDINDAHTQSK